MAELNEVSTGDWREGQVFSRLHVRQWTDEVSFGSFNLLRRQLTIHGLVTDAITDPMRCNKSEREFRDFFVFKLNLVRYFQFMFSHFTMVLFLNLFLRTGWIISIRKFTYS